MSDRLRKTRPLTSLLDDLLSMQIPTAMRRKLAGLRADGARKKGRPKKGTLDLPENSTFGSALVMSVVMRALAGDVQAQKLIFYLIEGLPTKSIAYNATTGAIHDTDGIVAKLQALFATGALPQPPQTPRPEAQTAAQPEPAMSLTKILEPEPEQEQDEVF